ncbi:MAG TPA: PTS sugar transporter subunit IIA [bacterium]|nr:PTS sugar transporter subunit IIA [bacterium]HNS49074.1 PTS sugar transporter subunit IIA [bacterium]
MIAEYLVKEAIIPDLRSGDKAGVVREMVEALSKAGSVRDVDGTTEWLLEREKLGSTGIGQNIAVPHAKREDVKKLLVTVGLSARGIDFDALDGDPVNIVFLVLAPSDATGLHLKVLARIARLLKDKVFRNSLRSCKSAQDVFSTIKEEDERAV